MTDKEKFYAEAETYFAEGLFREIYSSELLCICNMANRFYAILPYMRNADSPDGIVGYQIDNKKFLLCTIKNDLFFLKSFFRITSKKTLNKVRFFINDSNIDKLRALKAKTDANGPNDLIDLQFEESIRNGTVDSYLKTIKRTTDTQPEEDELEGEAAVKLFLGIAVIIIYLLWDKI